MKSRHFLRKFTALWLVIALLAALMLSGCGKKTEPTPTGTAATNAVTGTVAPQGAEASGIPTQPGNSDTPQQGTETPGIPSQPGNSDTPQGTTPTPEKPKKAVKNVIFMVADGGGYDNFTLAGKVKEEMVNRGVDMLEGAKTEVTTYMLSRLGKDTVNGLYLNEFLVGSANTLLVTPHGDANNYKSYITDSAAAGTALSSGYKTTYCYAGIDSNKVPRASLTELARLNGMATGLVTTKSYVDATPLAFFTSHIIHRYEYQDSSMQALLSNIDVVIGEGTEYGDMIGGKPSSHPEVSASQMGYTVARNKTQLLEKSQLKDTKKLWAPILGNVRMQESDLASNHISYDVDASQSAEQPSLLEMTQAALQVLGTNIDDPNGFFLMIEGGALDNAAEKGYLRPTIGEYLAFDEAFAYCVDWAAQRGDTIVIAVPDHDSGGFYNIERCEDLLIDSIITGYIGEKKFDSYMDFNAIKEALTNLDIHAKTMQLHGGHTDMAVPICLFAPDSVRNELLTSMGLPTQKGDVRLGTNMYYVPNAGKSYTWYTSAALNNDYTIENSSIAPALAKILKLGTLEQATAILFNKVGSVKDGVFSGEYGGQIVFSGDVYDNSYAKFRDCSYVNEAANLTAPRFGTPLFNEDSQLSRQYLRPIFVLDEQLKPENGTFYLPYNYLTEYSELAWHVFIAYEEGVPTILLGKPNAGITLPDTPGLTYTDGTNTYHPGDTIPYNGSNIQLTAK